MENKTYIKREERNLPSIKSISSILPLLITRVFKIQKKSNRELKDKRKL